MKYNVNQILSQTEQQKIIKMNCIYFPGVLNNCIEVIVKSTNKTRKR